MKNLIKEGIKAFSIATLAGFLALGPVACAHKEQSTKIYPVTITRYTDEGVEAYDKDSIILETLILGSKVEQNIGGIIQDISPSAFKEYKIWFDNGRFPLLTLEGFISSHEDPYIDGEKIYESITVSEDKEVISAHQIWKYNNKRTSKGYDIYLMKDQVFELEGEDIKPSGGGGRPLWFEKGDLPWLEGSEVEYVNKKKEKKLVRNFFKIEEKNGKLDIKGYGSGGKTYYRQYD